MLLLLLTLLFQHRSCDWVSEWQTATNMEYRTRPDYINQMLDTFKLSMQNIIEKDEDKELSAMMAKLGSTLKNTQELSDILTREIREIEIKEKYLKELIFYGRSGVTIMNISTTVRKSRMYIIRDGFWSTCSGPIQPLELLFQENLSTPRCIGEEIPSVRDPCAFNSIIKYETIPSSRRGVYEEDHFLCLKPNFNNTLEQYQSVPRLVINETCKKGTIKGLKDNLMKCGMRIFTEYNYHPNRNALAADLLDYCSESEGVCKLMVAWSLSNSSIGHFEVLSEDSSFKKTFLKLGSL